MRSGSLLILALCLFLLNISLSAQSGIHYIDHDDFKTRAFEFGHSDSLPLLLINGGPGFSCEGFMPLARQLSQEYFVVIYDQRGTGKSKLSAIDSSTISMHQMVEDIEVIRKYFGWKEMVVMGQSFGGMLAYYYASCNPERVMGMIQSSSGGMDLNLVLTADGILVDQNLMQNDLDSLNYWRDRISGGDSSQHAQKKRIEFLAPAYVYSKDNLPIVRDRLLEGNLEINRLLWQDMSRTGFDCRDAMADFFKPVVIIHGAEDVVNPRIARNCSEILPNDTLHILEKSRHYGWLDQPEEYFSAIFHFKQELIKGRGQFNENGMEIKN